MSLTVEGKLESSVWKSAPCNSQMSSFTEELEYSVSSLHHLTSSSDADGTVKSSRSSPHTAIRGLVSVANEVVSITMVSVVADLIGS